MCVVERYKSLGNLIVEETIFTWKNSAFMSRDDIFSLIPSFFSWFFFFFFNTIASLAKRERAHMQCETKRETVVKREIDRDEERNREKGSEGDSRINRLRYFFLHASTKFRGMA